MSNLRFTIDSDEEIGNEAFSDSEESSDEQQTFQFHFDEGLVREFLLFSLFFLISHFFLGF